MRMQAKAPIPEQERADHAVNESEQRYKRLLASVTDYVYSVSVDQGRPTATVHGPGCEAVTGYNSSEFERDPFLWFRMIYSDDRPAVRTQAELVMRGETPAALEHRIKHKDGRLRWIRNTPVPHKDAEGRLMGYDGLVSDITERKRAEEQHRLSEARLQAILDHSPAAISLKDTRGHYLLSNRRFQQLLRLSREDIVGKSPHDLFPAETATMLLDQDQKALTTLAPVEFEETLPQDDGLHSFISVAFPLLDPAGVAYALCGIATDITERKQAEEKLARAYAELSENEAALKSALQRLQTANEELQATQFQLIQAAKLESVGTLAAGVAHEVKNPLQTILMGLDYLTNNFTGGNGNTKLVLNDMREAVTRANTIIRELLQLSAATDFAPAQEDLNVLVDRSLRLIHSETIASQITVERKLAPDLPRVRMDRNKMEQVFINLFINAIQAMSQGGILTVTTRHRRFGEDPTLNRPAFAQFKPDDPVVIAEVQDNGPGIPEDHLPRVFDPFFTTKPTGVGTGLGLSVVRKIMDLHGGAIEVRNGPLGGGLVTLLLRADSTMTP